MLHQNTE
jgi:hypothetical protein